MVCSRIPVGAYSFTDGGALVPSLMVSIWVTTPPVSPLLFAVISGTFEYCSEPPKVTI